MCAARRAAFSIFYMGINLGSFFGQLAAPYLAQHSQVKGFPREHGHRSEPSWQLGSGSAAVGMLFGVVQYVRGQRHLGTAGGRPSQPPSARDWLVLKLGVGATLAVVALIVLLNRSGGLTVDRIDGSFGIFLTIVTVGFFARLFLSDSGRATSAARCSRSWSTSWPRACSGRPSSRPARCSRCSPRTRQPTTSSGSSSRPAGTRT
jgi:POT family proton-dependent oligopeptide transporter